MSEIKSIFDQWRADGVSDLRALLDADPTRRRACVAAMRVVKVNRRTHELLGTTDLDDLRDNLSRIIRDDSLIPYTEELLQLWEGLTSFSTISVQYSLSGERLIIRVKGSMLPGHEADWSRVLVAIEDITAEDEARHQLVISEGYNKALFDESPIGLWVEDQSRLKALFNTWRAAGVTDPRAYIEADFGRAIQCRDTLRTLTANQRTLEIFGVADLRQLIALFEENTPNYTSPNYVEELVELWNGQSSFAYKTVLYSRAGTPLDVRLKGTILPGHEADWSRVLIAIEDISAEEEARRQLVISEAYTRALFNDSPVSIWVEDYSGVKRRLDALRATAIADFRTHIENNPEIVEACMREVRVIDVNRHTVTLFGAADKASLLSRLDAMFVEYLRPHFAEVLIDLWHGHLRQEREVVSRTSSGDVLNLAMQFAVMPQCQHDWSMFVFAFMDITDRKKAEARLEYLGSHDALTGLYNRAFYVDESDQLDRKGPFPVSVIMADLNGLKITNDTFGHSAGDRLIIRAGAVLCEAVAYPGCAMRIGGDEFAVFLPATDAAAAAAIVTRIGEAIERDNLRHGDQALSLSIGVATCDAAGKLEATIGNADARMYQAKQRYYATTHGVDRRRRLGRDRKRS